MAAKPHKGGLRAVWSWRRGDFCRVRSYTHDRRMAEYCGHPTLDGTPCRRRHHHIPCHDHRPGAAERRRRTRGYGTRRIRGMRLPAAGERAVAPARPSRSAASGLQEDWKALRTPVSRSVVALLPARLAAGVRSPRGRTDCAALDHLARQCERYGAAFPAALAELALGGARWLPLGQKENRMARVLAVRARRYEEEPAPALNRTPHGEPGLLLVAHGLRLLGIYACAVRGSLRSCPCLASVERAHPGQRAGHVVATAAAEWNALACAA